MGGSTIAGGFEPYVGYDPPSGHIFVRAGVLFGGYLNINNQGYSGASNATFTSAVGYKI